MASNEQSVTLLRKNKRAQVEALNSIGFDLTEEARAADFPMLIKWGAGLLDVTVAANRISDNRKFFFTIAEWQSLSATEQALFLLRGVRVRACGQSFIIASEAKTGLAWGATGKEITYLHNYSTGMDLYTYYGAKVETDMIAEAYSGSVSGGVSGAPAAEAALAYKAFTASNSGVDDVSEWCLPTPAHLMIIFRWINEINAVFSTIWGNEGKIRLISYWSTGRSSTSTVYILSFGSGGSVDVQSSALTAAVLPICLS